MVITKGTKLMEAVSYYPLPNSDMADVFMRKNMTTELDEEGNTIYIADEISYQISQDITKEQIENNFDAMWEDGWVVPSEPTEIEKLRIEQAEGNAELFEMVLMLTGGGI